MDRIRVFWFRRDLRLTDNHALSYASARGGVLPIFIFDTAILKYLPKDDKRVSFIYSRLLELNKVLKEWGSGLQVYHGKPKVIFEQIVSRNNVQEVVANEDYEPYARKRDQTIVDFLETKDISFKRFKDQVIYGPNEILKMQGDPYTVYTPFNNKWLSEFKNGSSGLPQYEVNKGGFFRIPPKIPALGELGFKDVGVEMNNIRYDRLSKYAELRDFPALEATSMASVHLRFGTISIRQLIQNSHNADATFLNELIWREFFMQILFHFPNSVEKEFKEAYRGFPWVRDMDSFTKWCEGKTGYPLVDAGMRQLNQTGFMHNRVRMVCAGFLCKHLLIDWRWGADYFAQKLMDFDLSANTGNWQWAASTGCDAVPYFRIFNPLTQQKRFDPKGDYIKKWIPELDSPDYPNPIVDHKMARENCLKVFKMYLAQNRVKSE